MKNAVEGECQFQSMTPRYDIERVDFLSLVDQMIALITQSLQPCVGEKVLFVPCFFKCHRLLASRHVQIQNLGPITPRHS